MGLIIMEQKQNIPKKRISIEEFKKKSTSKIITDGRMRTFTLPVSDTEELEFKYKPLTKKQYFDAQSTQNSGKVVDQILSHTLWDDETGDFWNIDDLNETFDYTWQTLIFNEIFNGSGQVVTEEDKDF